MARPLIAVVGSVDESRTFDPPVPDSPGARAAAEQLGRQLALAGWDLIVYSAEPKFIEHAVVHGYVTSGKANAGSIHVHTPTGRAAFPELSAHRKVFSVWTDPSAEWQVSYYRSLFTCQAVALIGGGRSTLVTGTIMLASRVPILALASFGGSARKVWGHIAADGQIVTAEDVRIMAEDWQDDSAKRLVDSLTRQHRSVVKARQAEKDEERRMERRRAITTVVMAALLLVIIAGYALTWLPELGAGIGIGMLALMPTVAGAVGGLAKASLDEETRPGNAAVLGAIAGFVTGVLYIASQLIGAPQVLNTDQAEAVRRLMYFVVPIGVLAGLTSDALYRRWRKTDVSQSGTIRTVLDAASGPGR